MVIVKRSGRPMKLLKRSVLGVFFEAIVTANFKLSDRPFIAVIFKISGRHNGAVVAVI